MRQKIIVGNNTLTLDGNVIFECNFTRDVNVGNDLTLGSTPSACLTARVYGHSPTVTYGTQIKYYEDDELISTMYCERPTILSESQYQIEAFDSVSKLEKNMLSYLNNATFPMTLKNLAIGVCNECGLIFETESFPNDSFQVGAFSANISARELLECIGEVSSRYVYAKPNGNIAFGWYTLNESHEIAYNVLGASKTYHVYYMDGLKYENFETQSIGGVEILTEADRSGVKYPSSATDNIYEISYNILLNDATEEQLTTIAQNIYNELSFTSYRPCTFRIPYTKDIKAGDRIFVTEPNGNRFATLVFTTNITSNGLECSSAGSETRDSASHRSNTQSYRKELNGAMAKFSVELDEIRGEVLDTVIGGQNLIINAIDLEGHVFL